MHNNESLAGKTIIVTRPLTQARNICTLLERYQATVVHFPVISITPANNISAAKKVLSDYSNFNLIIFISANAVHYAISLAKELGLSFKNDQIAVIGPATKTALETYGYHVGIIPQNGYTSEALLNHPSLQKIDEQKILIVRGCGGREHLRQVLESRGANIDYAEVYQRQLPKQRNTIDLSKLSKKNSVILIYSKESLQNLWALCNPEERAWIKCVSIIAGGQRIADSIDSAVSTKNSIIAENPTDKAMLEAVLNWAQEN